MLAGNQSRGTGSYPMRTTDQSPVRARAVTSGPTGRVHSLPRSTSRSQAARLYATGSRFSVTAVETSLAGRSGGDADQGVEEVGEFGGRIGGEAAVHRAGLDDGGPGRGEPAEALPERAAG